MAWKMFEVTYELRSPLHIGYHRVGNLQRTRYYIPARNLWGAVTEALTRRGFHTDDAPEGDYKKIGEWVKTHCAFGYWFVCEGGQPLTPCYGEDGLKYGTLTVGEFERRYLDAHVATALAPASTSAQDGSLHEVEFIAAYNREGARTRLGGLVFLDATAQPMLGSGPLWRKWLGTLSVGGERRYGFGQLRLPEFANASGDGWELGGERPILRLQADEPLRAHALANGVHARGAIEPLVGRETQNDSRQFGMSLTQAQVCWVPGSVIARDADFTLAPNGIWRPKG